MPQTAVSYIQLVNQADKKLFVSFGFTQIGTFFALSPKTEIKSLKWLLRSMRLFYFDCLQGNAVKPFADQFQSWVQHKCPGILAQQKFISNFFVTLYGQYAYMKG